MRFELGRLRRGEWTAGAAALVLLVVMFLDWFELRVGAVLPGGTVLSATLDSWTAWQSFSVIDLILLLTVVLGLVLVVLTATQPTAAIPLSVAVVTTAVAIVATLLVAFRVLIDQPGMGLGLPDTAIDNTVWAYVGLVACAGIVAGAWLSLRDEGGGPPQPEIPARRVGHPAP